MMLLIWVKRWQLVHRAKSLIKLSAIVRILAKTVYKESCWIYTGHPSHDWPEINFEGSKQKLGRVAYKCLIGPIPRQKHILHTCDKGRCWNPDHIYAGTHQQNMLDKENRNRGNHSSWKNSRATITIEQALEIKRLLTRGMSIPKIVKITNIKYQIIANISCGRNWKNV